MIGCNLKSTRLKEDEKKYYSPADNVGIYFYMYFILNWFIFLTIKFPGAKLSFRSQLSFYGNQECIVVFAGAHHWPLSWVR